MIQSDPLTFITLTPLAVGLALLILPYLAPASMADFTRKVSRSLSMGVALSIFAITTALFLGQIGNIDWLNITQGQYVFQNEPVVLLDSIGVRWVVGVDALSFPMVWLTALLIPISMLVEWDAKKGHLFHPLILIMEGALIGVFVVLDLFVFYVFWELTLIPMFFLILVWGGDDRRYASMKFFIYTFTASVLMLIGILVMYFNTGDASLAGSLTDHHFDLVSMTAQASGNGLIAGEGLRHFVWLLLLIGFATKMPSVPVHTWLPDAHVQAPTAGSMLLAGVMLKMGAYGFLRIAVTIFPESTVVFTPLLIILGMASLVYGAIVCMGQSNLKRMVAYSSVSHMGLIFLGIATMQPLGIAGALFMMFAHGIISPLLFAVAGAFKHHYHTLEIGSMRGIAHHSPWLAGHMMLGWMASLGLPLLAGFVAEIAVMIAFWMTFGWLVIWPALTLVITAVYYLTSMQRTIFEGGDPHVGILPDTMHGEEPRDITWHENAGMFVLGALTILFGIMPFIFWDMMSDWSTEFMLQTLVEAMNSQGGEALMLTTEEMEILLPELTLVAGIILAVLIPNLGDSKLRIPMTRTRIPILIGGTRFKTTSDPRVPARIGISALFVAFVISFLEIESASGEVVGGVIEITSFTRMMSFVFYGALLLAAIATSYRMPARLSARAPTEKDSESRVEALVAALMDNRRQVDFHILLMMVGLGMGLMAMASNLFFMFVAIELASLAAYVLVAFHKEEEVGGEAGAKYFIVGSVASATGIYGMSLVYLWSGDLNFDALAASWAAMDGLDPFAVIGVGLMLVAFGFKVSAAPFHLAAPDAYAGASSPVAGVLATASKAMGFVALFRVLIEVTMPEEGEALWFGILAIIAVITMTWGNLAALTSENPKRMLAYSSVAHAGYMLAAMAAVGSGLGDSSTTELVLVAIVFHLTILVLFKLGAFLVLGMLETEGRSHRLEDLHGLAQRDPLIAGSMFIFMLALAGVPPLSGFLSKLLMINGIVNISAGTGSTSADGIIPWAETVDPVFWLAMAIVLNSALSLFYYLRIGLVMFFEAPENAKPLRKALHLRNTILVLTVLTVFFGIGSGAEYLLELVETAVSAL